MLGLASSPQAAVAPPSTYWEAHGATMRWLSAIISALLALTLGINLLQHMVTRHPHSRTPPLLHRLAPHHGLSSLPLAAQGAVSATLGAKNPTYRVTASGDGFQAQSSAQRLRMRFGSARIQIGSGKTQVGLSCSGPDHCDSPGVAQ